jgi:hypothetical protein
MVKHTIRKPKMVSPAHVTPRGGAKRATAKRKGGFAVLPFLPLITAIAGPIVSAIGQKIASKIKGKGAGFVRAGATRRSGGTSPAIRKAVITQLKKKLKL